MGIYFALAVLAVMYSGLAIAALRAPPPKTITRLDTGVRIATHFVSILCILSQFYLFFTNRGEIYGITWGNINLGSIALFSSLMGYVLYRSEQPQ